MSEGGDNVAFNQGCWGLRTAPWRLVSGGEKGREFSYL